MNEAKVEQIERQGQYDQLRDMLQETIGEFADQHQISPKFLARLLVDLGVSSDMADYLIRTTKPSSMGLKRELDRFQRDIDDFIRSSKKSADETVAQVKDYLSTYDRPEALDVSSAA